MRKIIHHVRRQPEGIKRKILHVSTGVFAVLLFALWVVSLGRNFNSEPPKTVSENASPFQALKANILGGYESLTEPGLEVIQ